MRGPLPTLSLALLSSFAAGCGGSAAPAAPSPSAAAASAAPPAALVTAITEAADRALAERPDHGGLLYLRASLAAEVGDRPGTLGYLERLGATDWSNPISRRDFGPVVDEPRFQAVEATLASRLTKVQRSTVAFTIPEPDLIPEGIASDPATGTIYLGSMRKRKVLAIDRSGRTSVLVAPGQDDLLSPLGMKVDGARGLLWVGSYASRSMIGHDPSLDDDASVMAFDLKTGRLRRQVPYGDQVKHQPNDMAITADGAVYVTDSLVGKLYRIPPDRDALEPVAPDAGLLYPNGIALAADGRLYVADQLGIAIIEPASGKTWRLDSPASAPLGGIDGLLLHDGRLVAVQNGVGLPRMVAFPLDPSGERVTEMVILENDPAGLEIPTTACVVDDSLYTIANSQIQAFRPGGAAERGELQPPRILRTPLR